jgi:hypothetical protein
VKKLFAGFAVTYLSMASLVMNFVWPETSYGAAFLADLTLSPVKTVLEIVVSPTATSVAASLASTDSAADRQQVMNAVASDAADHLSGAEPSPLLREVHTLLRNELARRGDAHLYSDVDLSKMIAAEVSAS